MRVFVLGIWGTRVGGANGECLGAVQLWRRHGLDVTLIPTWTPADNEAKDLATELGCEVIDSHPRKIRDIPGLAGSTVVNFCNENAYAVKTELAKMKCRFIAAPCMCYPGSGFRAAIQTKHIHAVVYQSEYQRSMIERRLGGLGYNHSLSRLIRGYFDWQSIEFRPLRHIPEEPFTIGRIARDSTNKWCKEWWQMYGRVPNRKAIVLGYGVQVARHCGKVPDWATVHRPGAVPAETVYRKLHAYVSCNGGVDENWPRTGLEAMAYGVPVVAENDFGWREMVIHGVTGALGRGWQEIGDMAAKLADNEDVRLGLAEAARAHLRTICDPDQIWDGWKEVLGV